MRVHKTRHPIADTISDAIGELPDGDYKIAYGILRHDLFRDGNWFEIDRGMWGANHYDGNYRLSFRGTQPKYNPRGPFEGHSLEFIPWREDNADREVIICPPTDYVCAFFGIVLNDWLDEAVSKAGSHYSIKFKDGEQINWELVDRVITFNSSIGVEALRRGIHADSDPVHSTIGQWNKSLDAGNRDKLFSFLQAHHFKLSEKEKLWEIIKYTLDGMPERL